MNNRILILMLIEKSANAFGELIGLTKDTKLKAVLTIIQDTIQLALGIDSIQMTSKELLDSIVDKKIDIDETHLLAGLLWVQAETLSQLKQPITSLRAYENTLQLIQWRALHVVPENALKKTLPSLKQLLKH